MLYLVVIGDVVASRTIPTRDKLQQTLATTIEHVNELAADRLASPYTITLGDEFQAVYKRSDSLLTDFLRLFGAIHPVKLRIAVGVSEITTPLNTRQALGMDGPAFYRARHVMEELKKQKGCIIQIDQGVPEPWLVNQSLRLLSRLLTGWKRETFVTLISLSENVPVGEIARRQGVTERAIYKRIRMNNLREILGIFVTIEAELDTVMRSVDEH